MTVHVCVARKKKNVFSRIDSEWISKEAKVLQGRHESRASRLIREVIFVGHQLRISRCAKHSKMYLHTDDIILEHYKQKKN